MSAVFIACVHRHELLVWASNDHSVSSGAFKNASYNIILLKTKSTMTTIIKEPNASIDDHLLLRPFKKQRRSITLVSRELRYEEISSFEDGGIDDRTFNGDDETGSVSDSSIQTPPHKKQREETIIDNVMDLFEEYEEASLALQCKYREKAKQGSASNNKKSQQKLTNEKLKCLLFKVLTLFVQSESRLRGENHDERVNLSLRVQQILLDEEDKTLGDIMIECKNILLTKKDLFPPRSIAIPTGFSPIVDYAASMAPKNLSFVDAGKRQARATKSLRKTIQRLSKAANALLEKRMSFITSDHSDEEDEAFKTRLECAEGTRDILSMWSHLLELSDEPATQDQLEVLEGVLDDVRDRRCCIDDIIWNLALFFDKMG